MDFLNSKKGLALVGVLVGLGMALLAFSGNPANMAMCAACFIRDMAGSMKLQTTETVQYFRPEIVGLVVGSFLIALATREYRSTAGSSPMTRFVLGFIMMIGALIFLGCPLRMVLRMAAGDLNAWVGLIGFVLGVATGTFFLKKGYSLGREHDTNKTAGAVLPVLLIIGLCISVFAGVFAVSQAGPGSKHAPVLIALVTALVIGALAQKARATYIVPPLAPDGPALNLRLFGDDVMSIEDLTARGALSPVMADFLGSAVRARCPVIISGGTGSGKTTMLGALSGFIPDDERVLTIEDTPELRLRAAHVERMQTREANTEGEGAVGMRELVALSLRRRPDRIIVGECRGAEAYEMLQAMQTDHPGSMTTVHANDPGNALSRLRTMVGYANADLGRDVIVQQIAESLAGGLIVHVERMRDGGRRVISIVAVDQMPEGATVIPRAELFRFEPRGMDAFGRITGAWRACGVQPQRIKQRMLAAGVRFDPSWFFGS